MAVPWSYGRFGYVLVTEEHSCKELLRFAAAAESEGFGFLFVSDHFHPWNFHQGHSSNIWPLLGALAQTTQQMALVSAVTSPVLRLHPTFLAQAASTAYHLSNGRFHLGVGTGEDLNEHITGEAFPNFETRLSRLEESIDLVRTLLSGQEVSKQGKHFTIDRAQLFDPAPQLQIFQAASGPKAAASASKTEGLICLGARPDLVKAFDSERKPKFAQLSVCWAQTRDEAIECAHKYFPEVAMPGTTFCELSTPREFTEAARSVRPEDVGACIACGPDSAPYLEAVTECFDAGFDAVTFHQIGPDQKGFLSFWERELKADLMKLKP